MAVLLARELRGPSSSLLLLLWLAAMRVTTTRFSDVEFVDPTATAATAKKKSNVGGGNCNSNSVLMDSPLLNSPAVRARARAGHRKADRMHDSDDYDDEDGDDGKKKTAGNAKKKDDTDDSDDELEIVGTKGVSALIDFPHSRDDDHEQKPVVHHCNPMHFVYQ